MENAFHPFRSTPSFLPSNSTFLSTKAACSLLNNRKIMEINGNDISFNSVWKTVTLIVFMVGLVGGFSAFLSITENNSYIDHSNDHITKYRCIKEYFTSDDNKFYYMGNCGFDDGYGILDNGVVINHENDFIVPILGPGLKMMSLISLCPPFGIIAIYLFIKACGLGANEIIRSEIDQVNNCMEDAINNINSKLPIDEVTALTKESIEELMDLNLLSKAEYKLLNFDQIKTLKNKDLDLFNKLLIKQRFSETQNLYWNKLKKIIELKDVELKRALQNPVITEMFEEEPRILETLILKMDQKCFNETINILASRLQTIHEVFSDLEFEKRVQIVEIMRDKIFSFEEAYTLFQIVSLENVGDVKLQFDNESISFPIHLLTFASPYFNKIIKDSLSDAKDTILLPDVDPNTFKELSGYLETGKFEVKENINIHSILAIADGYEFLSLFEQVETYLCLNIKSIINLVELMEEINLFPLIRFKKAFDIYFSSKLSAENLFTDEFLENLEIIKQFSLPQSFSKVVEIFEENILEITKHDQFINQFFKISQIDSRLMEVLFPSLIVVFETSDLLKTLWQEASKQECHTVQKEIIKLCNDPMYAYLSLAHWALPPKQIKKQCLENDEYELVELLQDHGYGDRESI